MSNRSKSIVRGHTVSQGEALKRALRKVSSDQTGLLRLRGYWGLAIHAWAALLRTIAPPLPNKILICIPRGGLNDVLCQTQRCIVYAARSRRQLLLNTSDSTIGQFDQIFLPSSLRGAQLFDSLPAELESLSVWPPAAISELRNRDCDLGWSEAINGYLTFDFRQQYNEQVLIHSGRGGGFGLDLLRTLKLSEPLRARIAHRLAELPKTYDALQVRNSDIKSAHEKWLPKSGIFRSGKPLLLCTDDEQVASTIETTLASIRPVFMLRTRREDSTIPLHYDTSIDSKERNFHLMLDLLAMAKSRRLFLAPQADGQLSGFPRLAKSLHAHPQVLASLLSQGSR